MRDLLTSTVYIGRGEAIEAEPLTVRALDHGERQVITVKFGHEPTLQLDWSEADALASMLSDAAEAIFEEVTR